MLPGLVLQNLLLLFTSVSSGEFHRPVRLAGTVHLIFT